MAQDYYNMSKTHPFNERHFPQRRFGAKVLHFFYITKQYKFFFKKIGHFYLF